MDDGAPVSDDRRLIRFEEGGDQSDAALDRRRRTRSIRRRDAARGCAALRSACIDLIHQYTTQEARRGGRDTPA